MLIFQLMAGMIGIECERMLADLHTGSWRGLGARHGACRGSTLPSHTRMQRRVNGRNCRMTGPAVDRRMLASFPSPRACLDPARPSVPVAAGGCSRRAWPRRCRRARDLRGSATPGAGFPTLCKGYAGSRPRKTMSHGHRHFFVPAARCQGDAGIRPCALELAKGRVAIDRRARGGSCVHSHHDSGALLSHV